MTPLAQQNLYEILEITPDSTAGEIEAAYARAREVYGPGSIITYSLMTPEDADLLSARLEEARSTLLDPAARARYDAGLGAEAEAAPSPWPSELPPSSPLSRSRPARRIGKTSSRTRTGETTRSGTTTRPFRFGEQPSTEGPWSCRDRRRWWRRGARWLRPSGSIAR